MRQNYGALLATEELDAFEAAHNSHPVQVAYEANYDAQEARSAAMALAA